MVPSALINVMKNTPNEELQYILIAAFVESLSKTDNFLLMVEYCGFEAANNLYNSAKSILESHQNAKINLGKVAS